MKVMKLKQQGDTIVEVLIAVAVLSLVLVVSYATANRNYLTMEDAQERSNAGKLLERQIEALKADNEINHGGLFDTPPLSNYCMVIDNAGNITKRSNNGVLDGHNLCVVDSGSHQAAAAQEPSYSIIITTTPWNPGGKLFMVTVKWDSILGNGQNSAQMEYVLY